VFPNCGHLGSGRKTGILALPHSIESLTLHSQKMNGEAIYAEDPQSAMLTER